MIRIQLRRDTPFRWMALNPVLADGEPGVELGTGLVKIGDGTSAWSELKYVVPKPTPGAEMTSLPNHINADLPHPIYDDGPNLTLLYENAKV